MRRGRWDLSTEELIDRYTTKVGLGRSMWLKTLQQIRELPTT